MGRTSRLAAGAGHPSRKQQATRVVSMTTRAQRLRRAPGEVRAVVFAAVEELLREVSVSDLSVERIIVQAEISRSTFYAHFTSKYHLLTALLDDLEVEFDKALGPWFSTEHEDPEVTLRVSLTAVSELWRKHQPIMRAASETWHMVPELGARWVELMNHYIDTIAARIDYLRQRGLAPQGVNSKIIAQVLGWGGERMHYVAGWNLYGAAGESDAVEVLMTIWLGAIYQLAPRRAPR